MGPTGPPGRLCRMTLMDEDLELLDEEACLALLGSTSIGRVAVTLGALPAVLP
jgi:hypothetical protein